MRNDKLCLLWELWVWDHHEINLISSSSRRPYFSMNFVLLDPTQGDLGLPQFSATSIGFLFYGLDSCFSLLTVRQGSLVLLFLLCFRFYFLQPFVRSLRTSVPLYFSMLALPSWASMSIFLFFGMRLWGFELLFSLFLHIDSKLKFYLIFGAFVH